MSVSGKNQEVRELPIEQLNAQFANRPDQLRQAVPNYPPGAKRMLRDNGLWAAALQSTHTTVVTAGISTGSSNGESFDNDGVEQEVHIVVLATGIQAIGLPQRGRGRRSRRHRDPRLLGRRCTRLQRHHSARLSQARPHLRPKRRRCRRWEPALHDRTGGRIFPQSLYEVLQRGVSVDVKPPALTRLWTGSTPATAGWDGAALRAQWYQNAHGRVPQVWPYTNAEYWEIIEIVSEGDHSS